MSIYGIYSLNEVKDIAVEFSIKNDIIKSNNWANMRFENGLDGGSIPGWTMSDTAKQKISEWSSNRRHSDETKQKIGKKHKNKIVSESTREKLKNRCFTDEQRKNISIAAKHRKKGICIHCNKEMDILNLNKYHNDNCQLVKEKELIQCEYCHAQIDKCNYSRWHGTNCKNNPNITKNQLKKREPWNKK